MYKLTTQDLMTSDLQIIIPVSWFSRLAEETRQEVKDLLYGYTDRGNDSHFAYTVPGYLAQQLSKIAKRI